MKCKDCQYCYYAGLGISGGYQCKHPDIVKSAKQYEDLKNKRIYKDYSHIGYHMIKTSLRHCPFKILHR